MSERNQKFRWNEELDRILMAGCAAKEPMWAIAVKIGCRVGQGYDRCRKLKIERSDLRLTSHREIGFSDEDREESVRSDTVEQDKAFVDAMNRAMALGKERMPPPVNPGCENPRRVQIYRYMPQVSIAQTCADCA